MSAKSGTIFPQNGDLHGSTSTNAPKARVPMLPKPCSVRGASVRPLGVVPQISRCFNQQWEFPGQKQYIFDVFRLERYIQKCESNRLGSFGFVFGGFHHPRDISTMATCYPSMQTGPLAPQGSWFSPCRYILYSFIYCLTQTSKTP